MTIKIEPRPMPVKLTMYGMVIVPAPIVAATKFKTEELMLPALNKEVFWS